MAAAPPRLNLSSPKIRQKSSKREEQSIRTGPWTEEEHKLFLKGLAEMGPGHWAAVSKMVPTRTAVQTTSHAQKYLNKMQGKRKALQCVPQNEAAAEKQNPFKKVKVYPAANVGKDSRGNEVSCPLQEESK